MEMATVSGVYYKLILMPFLEHYLTLPLIKKYIKFLTLLSNPIFLGKYQNKQNMQETRLYLNNSHMCWLDKSFTSK
jgi:hypothetical protein